MNIKTQKLADMISECENIVFFGGAGTSTESGIKDYRSKDGLYSTVKEYGVSPETILSKTFFYEHTSVFYDFYTKYFVSDAQPNPTHEILAKLEERGKLKACITQNIDGLHQAAGSKNVIELHGSAKKHYCIGCNNIPEYEKVLESPEKGSVPHCDKCNNIIKPGVVLYEEQLYDGVCESAVSQIKNADMLIIGGTSLAVYPAASFVKYFNGKYLVIINKSETPYDSMADLVICDSIGKVFSEVYEIIKW